MTNRAKLAPLRDLSQLILQTKLMSLEKASRARQHCLDNLAELDRPNPDAGLNPIVAGEVAMRYALWADQRRSDLNVILAKRTAEWIEARDAAAKSFGRDQALSGLSQRKI